MDCLNVITSRGLCLNTIASPGINVGCKMSQPMGFHMDTMEEQRLEGCHPSQNGCHGHSNGFGATGVSPLFQNGTHGTAALHQNGLLPHNGCQQFSIGKYHPGMMTGNGFNIPCSAPFGSRKRSLDDDDQDEFKRRRTCGEYEASMTFYSPGFPDGTSDGQMGSMMMDSRPEPMYSTSAMEHQTTMEEAQGYDDMYLYNIIAQMHGS